MISKKIINFQENSYTRAIDVYTSSKGYFSIARTDIHDLTKMMVVRDCREEFDWQLYNQYPLTFCEIKPEFDFATNNDIYISFSCKPMNDINLVNSFFEKFQTNLPEEYKIVIHQTTHSNTLCFKLNKFWNHRVRNSLLTLIIRYACAYYKEGDNLTSNTYVNAVKESIQFFIKGNFYPKNKTFTKQSSEVCGWFVEFNRVKQEDLSNYLLDHEPEIEVIKEKELILV